MKFSNVSWRDYRLVLFVLLLFGCTTPRHAPSFKRLVPYPASLSLRVYAQIFHTPEGATHLFVQTPTDRYRITLRAYDSFKGKHLLLELSEEVNLPSHTIKTFDITTSEAQYALEIILTDLKNQQVFHDFLNVEKRFFTPQNLLITDTSGLPLLKNYVAIGTPLRLLPTNRRPIFVRFYQEPYRPAPPPFVRAGLIFNSKVPCQAIFSLSEREFFTPQKKGLYFIQHDTLVEQGVFLNCFEEDFPRLTDAENLVLSVRYISKNEEYQRLLGAGDQTKAFLDQFWLARGGNKEKARQLISRYYNRIQLANEYFSTYKEGWKTDRGIIYTIFGNPDWIQKTEATEYWLYQRTQHREAVEFFFDKRNNDSILRRFPMLEAAWEAEIYLWRQGKIED